MYFTLQKNTARVSTACERLINKVHLYEVLFTFESTISRLRLETLDVRSVRKLKTEANILLREVIRFFIHARDLIANPRRSMPCSKLFDDSLHRPHNPYPTLAVIVCFKDRQIRIDICEEMSTDILDTHRQCGADHQH